MSHRHEEAIDRAFLLAKSLHANQNDWKKIHEKSNVEIFAMETPDLPISYIRGNGTIIGPWTVQEIISVIRSSFARKMCNYVILIMIGDARFEYSSVIEYLTPEDALVYNVQKGTFPVAPRDFVTVGSIRLSIDSPSLYISTSVMDSKAPSEDHDKVRGYLKVSAWVFDCQMSKINLSYIVGVDTKGNIPSCKFDSFDSIDIVKMVQTQTPMCIKEVEKYLIELGPLPFIVRSEQETLEIGPGRDITLQHEAYDPDTATYTIEYQSNPSICAEGLNKLGFITVAFPSRIFRSGVKIQSKIICSASVTLTGQLMENNQRSNYVSGATSFCVMFWLQTADAIKEPISVRMIASSSNTKTVTIDNAALF